MITDLMIVSTTSCMQQTMPTAMMAAMMMATMMTTLLQPFLCHHHTLDHFHCLFQLLVQLLDHYTADLLMHINNL